MSRPLALLRLLFLLFAAAARAATNAACYDPAGQLAPGYFPCDATAYITNCCAAGWTCFSSALCVVTPEVSAAYPNLTTGTVARAMCTNPLWNDDICGDFCNVKDTDRAGDMVACGDDRFCCSGDYKAGQCSCESGSFVVRSGRAQTVIDVPGATFSGVPSYLTSLPATTTTTASVSATISAVVSKAPSPFASTLSRATASPTASAASTAPTSTFTSTSTSTSTPSSSSKHTLAVGLGAGLGAGIPVLALVGFGVFWWLHRGSVGGGRSSLWGGRRTLPSDLALDGTAFGERMAMQGDAYQIRGPGVHNFDTLLPPPPPPMRNA